MSVQLCLVVVLMVGVDCSVICTSKMLVGVHCGQFVLSDNQFGP